MLGSEFSKRAATLCYFAPAVGQVVDIFLQNDPNGMFLDGDGVYHLYYQCESGDSRE